MIGPQCNGSAARRHGSQSHGFAVRVWSTMCICSPVVVELVRSILALDFPLFHGYNIKLHPWLFESIKKLFPCFRKLINDFPQEVSNLCSTDDGEPSEQAHGSSNCRQHVHKLCCSILLDSVKC